MSRLVQPVVRYVGTPTRAPDRAPEPASAAVDEYSDRVAKYIPGEVVGGYVSLDGILSTPPHPELAGVAKMQLVHADVTALSAFMNLQTGVFVFCLILAPLYVWHLARRAGNQVWKAQAFISMLAFGVWAYAIKGAVFFSNPALDEWSAKVLGHPFYDPKWAAALLILFSLAAAFYQPTKTVDLGKGS